MKTPIEELKEHMFSGKNYYVDQFFKPFIEKEKQVIADAYDKGVVSEYSSDSNTAFMKGEQYYKETFNNQTKNK